MHRFLLAYIDPGTGSLIFQMLVAGALSALVVFKAIRLRIVYLFRAIFRLDPKDEADASEGNDIDPLASADVASTGDPAQPTETAGRDSPGAAP